MLALHDPPAVKVPLTDLTPLLTCGLCKGFLVGATTITECLHTFCKSCLVRHVMYSLQCPTCRVMIHPSDPFINMRSDSTWQDILYKMLPGVEREAKMREREFYESRGLPYPTSPPPKLAKKKKDTVRKKVKPVECLPEHMIPVHLQYCGIAPMCGRYKPLLKRYMNVNGKATISHMETFLHSKMGLNDSCQAKLFVDSFLLHESLTLENVRDVFFSSMKQGEVMAIRYGIMPAGNWFHDVGYTSDPSIR